MHQPASPAQSNIVSILKNDNDDNNNNNNNNNYYYYYYYNNEAIIFQIAMTNSLHSPNKTSLLCFDARTVLHFVVLKCP